jgi:hypothetical protein
MDLQDYLLSFLTKGIRWETLLERERTELHTKLLWQRDRRGKEVKIEKDK